MPPFSNLQIPPPSNWQDFESLCCDLWREIWEDPNTEKNGRQGQPQNGVDICGRPNRGDFWGGVQCKCKNNDLDKNLTESEVEAEVQKAKNFEPKLSEFIIATTIPKDVKIESLARKITQEHLKEGLFSVNIWGWDDIKERLDDYPNVLKKHYPQTINNFKEIEEKIDLCILTTEYQQELNDSKDLIKNNKPCTALELLEYLKGRIWATAQPVVKYQILTSIGSAKLKLNQEIEAARYFIEAWKYNPDDENSLCNQAFGFLLIGQSGEAKQICKKVLLKNPAHTRTLSIIIQASSEEVLKNIIKKIPKPYRTSYEVAIAISHLELKKVNFVRAEKWLEIAIKKDKEDSPELKGHLGTILLQQVTVDKTIYLTRQIGDKDRKRINKSINLLTEAWEAILHTDLVKYRLEWIVNRSIARSLLGDMEGASKDIETARIIDPSNQAFIKNMAALAYESNDIKKSIDLLKGLLDSPVVDEAHLLLAFLLMKENKAEEAIDVLNNFLSKKSSNSLKNEASRLLIQCFIDLNDIGSAKKISSSILASNPRDTLNLIDSAKILRISGKVNEAKNLLKDLRESTKESLEFRELCAIADEFYLLGEFEDASLIYEKITAKKEDNFLTNRLIKSLYFSGQRNKVIDVCKNLRENSGSLISISHIESSIYEQIGDLEKAVSVCLEYLDKYPNDNKMRIRLGIIYLRQGNFQELDKLLESGFSLKELPLDLRLQLVFLYEHREFYKKTLEIIYEIRREFYNDKHVHENYVYTFLRIQNKTELLDFDKVTVDCAVCFEDYLSEKKWFIIESQHDPNILLREISMEDKLAKEFLGKSVNDEVLLNKNYFSNYLCKIIEIKSKYSYAFSESIKLLSEFFTGTTEIYSTKISEPEKKGELPEEIKKFIDLQSARYLKVLGKKQIYKEKNITVGQFTNLIRESILESLLQLIKDPNVGLKCCLGSIEERNIAVSLLVDKPRLVIDIISLITLDLLDAKDLVSNSFGKIYIVQSTIDLLKSIIEERKSFSGDSFKIWEESGKISFFEILDEDSKNGIQHLEKLLKWAKNNCKIVPCTLALNINARRKEKLDKRFGSSFVDTVIVASQPGYLLYSDDFILRNFANSQFNVNGIWTQAMLMYCLEADLLNKKQYDKIIVKLAGLNYYHTSVSANILIEAAKQSNWLPLNPYLQVINTLKSSDELSTLTVATNYLNQLWQYEIAAELRECLVFSLINVITAGREVDEVLYKLSNNIIHSSAFSPFRATQTILLIDKWKLDINRLNMNCGNF